MTPPFKGRKRRTRDYQHLPPLVAKKEFLFFPTRAVSADRWMKETIEARARPPLKPPLHTHVHTHTSLFSRTCNSNSFYFCSLCILNRGKLFLLGYSTLLRARHVKERKGREMWGVCVEGRGGGGGVAHMANTKKIKQKTAVVKIEFVFTRKWVNQVKSQGIQ